MTPVQEFELFEHMVATGSMSEAGRKVGVSPAVVSEHISALERRLGAQLFYRPTARLELTANGKAYYANRSLPKVRRITTSITTIVANDNVAIHTLPLHPLAHRVTRSEPDS